MNFKNLHSFTNSLDLNSTPLEDADRNKNGSAGAIGEHRKTATKQQRDPLVQNKRHDINIGLNWHIYDPILKNILMRAGKGILEINVQSK